MLVRNSIICVLKVAIIDDNDNWFRIEQYYICLPFTIRIESGGEPALNLLLREYVLRVTYVMPGDIHGDVVAASARTLNFFRSWNVVIPFFSETGPGFNTSFAVLFNFIIASAFFFIMPGIEN